MRFVREDGFRNKGAEHSKLAFVALAGPSAPRAVVCLMGGAAESSAALQRRAVKGSHQAPEKGRPACKREPEQGHVVETPD